MELKKYKLGELLDVKRGASLAGEYYSTSGNYIRLTCGNFDYQNNSFKLNTSKDNLYYTGPVREEFIMKKGDIITPLTEQAIGLLGSTAIIPEDDKYIQSQDIAKVICNEDLLCPSFAFYLISSDAVKKQLSAAAQQTKIRHTSPDKIKDCTVWIPDLPTQEKVGRILSDIDSKIALNRAINQNLEALAKQLYDYWFVQFDFPNEEGKPYKSSGGAMVWNEKLKREIPKGWQVQSLETLGSFKNGINYSKDEVGNFDYRIVNVRNISSSSLFIDTEDLDEICLKSESADNYLVDKDDILIARSGTPGATRILQNEVKSVVYCGFIICYSVKDQTLKPLLTYQLKDLERITKDQSNGSILSNISQDVLKKLQAVIPSIGVLQNFNRHIYSIWYKFDQTLVETSNLVKQRDELLPLLMNGQVSLLNCD